MASMVHSMIGSIIIEGETSEGIEVYSGVCLSRLCLVPINVFNLLNDIACNMSSTCRDDCNIYYIVVLNQKMTVCTYTVI